MRGNYGNHIETRPTGSERLPVETAEGLAVMIRRTGRDALGDGDYGLLPADAGRL